MTSDEQWMKRWEEIRSRGMGSYVVKYGVLGWGVGTGIVVNILHYLLHRSLDFREAWLNLLFYPVGGILVGLGMWHMNQHLYAKQIRKRGNGS